MKYFQRAGSEPADEFDLAMTLGRIALTLLFGGLLVLGWRLLAQDRPQIQFPRRRRVLNIEEAIRWRPEF
jgi:hypothetical protein